MTEKHPSIAGRSTPLPVCVYVPMQPRRDRETHTRGKRAVGPQPLSVRAQAAVNTRPREAQPSSRRVRPGQQAAAHVQPSRDLFNVSFSGCRWISVASYPAAVVVRVERVPLPTREADGSTNWQTQSKGIIDDHEDGTESDATRLTGWLHGCW